MQHLLVDTLASLAEEFSENEMAYLALTVKAEFPIRDRWGYALFKQLDSDRGIAPAREWKKADLALVKNDEPLAIVEIKAMYTFDAVLDPRMAKGFPAAMLRDEQKARHLGEDDTQVYTMLVVTHPKNKVPLELHNTVKYRNGINRALKKLDSAEAVKQAAVDTLEKHFEGRNIVASGELDAGMAFGIDTSLLYWLIKADAPVGQSPSGDHG
jgi:hypothetical protein